MTGKFSVFQVLGSSFLYPKPLKIDKDKSMSQQDSSTGDLQILHVLVEGVGVLGCLLRVDSLDHDESILDQGVSEIAVNGLAVKVETVGCLDASNSHCFGFAHFALL